MYQKIKPILLLTTLFLLLLVGCATHTQLNSIESDITFLTSDACGGRLVGSAGNQSAVDFISAQFQKAELSYLLGDSFLLSYTQAVFDSDGSAQTITAEFADGHSETFLSGQNFYPFPIVGSLSLQGPVFDDSQSANLQEKILVSEVRSESPYLVQIIPSEYATSTLMYVASGGVPAIRINQAVFDRLEEATLINVNSDVKTKDVEVSNIVGVLPGTEHKSALILSAHFDHVGAFGDTIYQGALDNAAGVAVLLEVMRQMAAQSERPSFDVIFCALNGEDMGQQGSKAFADIELPYQTINVINLDTLGLSGSKRLAVAGDAGEFSKQIQTYMTASGVECDMGEFGASDHLSFQAAGIPAVTLSSWGDTPYDVIHTPKDTIKCLDIAFLDEVAVAVRKYVQTSQLVSVYRTAIMEEDILWERADRMATDAIQKYAPAPNQVVSFGLSGDRFYARDCSPINSAEEALAIWPTLKLPHNLGTYVFQRLHFQTAGDKTLRREIGTGDGLETTLIPVTQQDKIRQYCLDFLDESHQGITVTVYDNRYYSLEDLTALFDYEEKIMGEYTLIYQYTATQTGRTLNNIAYYNESLPCSFTIASIDVSNPIKSAILEAAVLENIEVLQTLSPLEEDDE